jgi:hypothetical protein
MSLIELLETDDFLAAKGRDQLVIFELLLKHGADPREERDGKSLLAHVCSWCSDAVELKRDFIEVLVKHGADDTETPDMREKSVGALPVTTSGSACKRDVLDKPKRIFLQITDRSGPPIDNRSPDREVSIHGSPLHVDARFFRL